MRLAVILLGVTLAAVLTVPAAATVRPGDWLAFELTPEEECRENELVADQGVLEATVRGSWCVVDVTSAEGAVDGFISFYPAVLARIPPPPEFFGFFAQAEIRTTFLVPEAPPEGSEIVVPQILAHLIIVWIFEADGIVVVPTGDPILHVVPPAPPPYFAGNVLGKVRYGEPFEVTVTMNVWSHRILVSQGGSVLAAAYLKKIFPHPDIMNHGTIFLGTGDLDAFPIWAFGAAHFRGLKSPAEVVIAGGFAAVPNILRVERIGSEVRVYLA